ncbi:MAG: methyltransferase [Pseudomonadota bacterium]
MAVFVTVLLPTVLVFWLVIHGAISLWRRTGVIVAYTVASVAMLTVGVFCWQFRSTLVGDDLGLNLLLGGIGVAVYLIMLFASRQVRRHLNLRTFAGIVEIENERSGLILEGPYRFVRHPRYFLVLCGILGWCFITNFTGTYWLGLASALGFYLIASLEERELVSRFGEAYSSYQMRVPKLVPHPSNFGRVFLHQPNRT